MDKICYINQPYGLGDIILCEPIARHYYNLGYKIKYWVKDEYRWIQDYIPYIDFISESDNYKTSNQAIFEENHIYLPLISKSISDDIEWRRVGWLYDKYTISKLNPELWKTFRYKRNIERENALYKHLNLENKEYILINEYSSIGHRSLNITSNYEIVKMSNIDGYTMLDWYKVMKNAKEVHTVSTSILFPLIKTKHLNITIYNRSGLNDGTFNSIKDIFEFYPFKYEI
jgi:hypothetical protein